VRLLWQDRGLTDPAVIKAFSPVLPLLAISERDK
jgi:hypothetical protein